MSCALYWSPYACLPITIGFVQPGMYRGMFLQTIGSRNTVPLRMLRIVPFGLFHIFDLSSTVSGGCPSDANIERRRTG